MECNSKEEIVTEVVPTRKKKLNMDMPPSSRIGNFSRVYMARYKNQVVALKKPPKKGSGEEQNLIREANFYLQFLRQPHKNIVQLVRWYAHPPRLLLEWCENDDLVKNLIKGNFLDWYSTAKILQDIIDGLRFLHTKKLSHGDLTAKNVLIFAIKPPHAKLGDFSDLKVCSKDHDYIPEVKGLRAILYKMWDFSRLEKDSKKIHQFNDNCHIIDEQLIKIEKIPKVDVLYDEVYKKLAISYQKLEHDPLSDPDLFWKMYKKSDKKE